MKENQKKAEENAIIDVNYGAVKSAEENAIMVVNHEEVKKEGTEKEKKKQAKSIPYALKATKEHLHTLSEAGMIDLEDWVQLQFIIERTVTNYSKKTFGL